MDFKTQAELRRKKILANADARLSKITGRPVEKNGMSKGPQAEECNTQPVNGSIRNGSCSRAQNGTEDTAHVTSHDFLYNQVDPPNDFMAFDEPRANALVTVEEKKTFRYDCFVFLGLGIIIRLLFYLNFSWLFLNNIIGPFILACIPKFSTILNQDLDQPGIYGIFIMALSTRRRFYIFFKIMFALRCILQFFALYFFSFVMGEYIFPLTNS